ncbi:MAG: hypothetical protein U0935_03590 [Pirellulales bacterium]
MDGTWLWAAIAHKQLWHLVPLVVIVSLAYGATRHEQWSDILDHALRFGVWILGFLAAIFLLLLWLGWGL